MISLADEPIRAFSIYISVFNILHLFLVLSTLSSLPGLLIYSTLSVSFIPHAHRLENTQKEVLKNLAVFKSFKHDYLRRYMIYIQDWPSILKSINEPCHISKPKLNHEFMSRIHFTNYNNHSWFRYSIDWKFIGTF